MTQLHRLAACLLMATAAASLLGACSDPPVSAAPPSPAPSVSLADLNAWIRFRLVYDLRSDVEWVLEVAGDPNAITNLGAPLLPSEAQQVLDAQASADALVSRARSYGNEYLSDFVGVWIEGPVVVVAFSDHVAERRAEAAALFGDKVVVREARYSVRELQGFLNAIERDRAWFESVGVELVQVDIEEMPNVVEISYRAPSRGVETLIRQRFEAEEWLRLTWFGPPRWTGPYGDMEVTVVDAGGRPVPFVLTLQTFDPRVLRGDGPLDIPDGRYHNIGIEAVEWVLEITYLLDGEETTVKREITVPPDGLAQLRLEVEP